VVLASTLGLSVACASIAGLEEPADVPPGLPEAATVTDAPPPAPDGGGGAIAETGTPDAAPDGPCPNAIFCESFDDDAGVPAWTKTDSGTAVWSLVENPVVSPPRALRVTNAGTGEAVLSRVVPLDNGITCEMSVRFTAWTGEGYFFELALDPANKAGFDYWYIQLGKQASDAIYFSWSQEQSQYQEDFASWSPPASNTWVRVAVDVRLRGGTTGVVVRFDGKEVVSRSAPPVPSSKTYLLSVGLSMDKSSTADDVFIDDVICRAL
jgi:hypothetical protein